MLSHSFVIYESNCSTVLGLLCHHFYFIMDQMFKISKKSGQQAGQHLDFSTTKLCCLIAAVSGLGLSI